MNQPTRRYLLRTPLIALAVSAYLTGCASVTDKSAQKTPPVQTQTARGEDKPLAPPYKGGGYYKDDGPGRNIPDNLDQVPDAVPRAEPLHRYANNPYKVMGKTYQPIAAEQPYKEQGLASWYGRKYHGRNTSSGEPYDMYAMTAAHATLPIPSYVRVTNLNNKQSVLVRVNDRGPFHEGRIIDLSYTAAYKLDVLRDVTPVEVELVSADAAPDSFIAQSNEVQTSAPVSEAATPATGEAIYLQLGAYANPASAEALLARAGTLPSRDLPGVMRLEAGGLHKVQAGPFMSVDAADKAIERIREGLDVRAIKVTGKAPATAASVATSAPTVAAPGIYLQLAALSSSAAADALGTKIKARFGGELPGLSHLVAGNLVKVQAGPFASADAAEKLALAYQQDFGVKPYKIRR